MLSLSYTYRSEVTQRELPNGVHQGVVSVARGTSAEAVARAVARDVEKLGGKFAPAEVAGVREERDMQLTAAATIGWFIIPPSISLFELGTKTWSEGACRAQDASATRPSRRLDLSRSAAGTGMFDDFKGGIAVTERRWYEEMRHTFPYSQWAIFDVHRRAPSRPSSCFARLSTAAAIPGQVLLPQGVRGQPQLRHRRRPDDTQRARERRLHQDRTVAAAAMPRRPM